MISWARRSAETVLREALDKVRADALVGEHVALRQGSILVGGRSLQIDDYRSVRSLALGKAAQEMTHGLRERLEGRLDRSLSVVKDGDLETDAAHRILAGDHPIPGERSLSAGRAAMEFARSADDPTVLLFCLVSGGASALAEVPRPDLSLDDLRKANQRMLADGRPIKRINDVRKRLSELKSGGLSVLAYGAEKIVLVLSDVIGGGVEDVGSGPFYPQDLDPIDPEEWMPPAMRSAVSHRLDRPGPVPPHVLIGDHRRLRQAATDAAARLGLEPTVEESPLTGAAEEAARRILVISETIEPGQAWIATGEPTVTVRNGGKGGRAQHIALLVAERLSEVQGEVAVLAAGSDGTDGPTEVAGAVIDQDSFATATRNGADARGLLETFDSYRWCQAANAHIRTGRTGTNLNDLYLVVKTGR